MARPEAPFNAEISTKKWVKKIGQERQFYNKDIFNLAKDIMRLQGGIQWQEKDPIFLKRSNPRLLVALTYSTKPDYWESIGVAILQNDISIEQFALYMDFIGRSGRKRFSTEWLRTPTPSPTLGYNIFEEDFAEKSLQPDERFVIAKMLWDSHLYTSLHPYNHLAKMELQGVSFSKS